MKQSFNMEQGITIKITILFKAVMATENLKGTMATVDAMKSANKVLKTQYKNINISKIEVSLILVIKSLIGYSG